MNDRIIALVAFLALFAWLWSTEHKNREERIAQRAAAASRIAHGDVAPPTATVMSVTDQAPAELCRSAEVFTVSSMPLPDGIPPGCYRVLDCRGVSRNIEITPEQISAADYGQAVPERDYYVKVQGGQHWIFENVRAIERAAMRSTPADERFVAGDVESYPTGACFESIRASTQPRAVPPPAAPQPMQWGLWLAELRSSAARNWGDRRNELVQGVEQRRQRAENSRGRAGRIVSSMAIKIEALGIRWMDRLAPAPSLDEIALPQPGGRSL